MDRININLFIRQFLINCKDTPMLTPNDAASLIISTIAISISGAFSPGPLTASAVVVGTRKFAKGGFLIAFGHMIFEFPYVMALALLSFSISSFLKSPSVSSILTLGIFGFIVFFSYINIKEGVSILKGRNVQIDKKGMHRFNPILIGVLLTGLNPYFLLWWVSIGLPLIQLSSSMGITYLLLMYMAHVWLDYLWLTFMGVAGERSAKILKSKGYGTLLILLGLMLVAFAVDISLKTFLNLNLLPF